MTTHPLHQETIVPHGGGLIGNDSTGKTKRPTCALVKQISRRMEDATIIVAKEHHPGEDSFEALWFGNSAETPCISSNRILGPDEAACDG